MPVDIRVVTPKDFIQIGTMGEIDLEGSRRLLRDMTRTCIAKGIRHVLLDARGIQPTLTFRDIYKLVSEFEELGMDRSYRLAILHRVHGFGFSDFLATTADHHGWNVASFDSFEAAFQWLNSDQ